MASGLLLVLDDIALLLDDTAALTKVAAKKTAGLLGDDLAVNAEKATGFSASRELHVLWAITKGSLLNKLIILPLAFLLSAFLPQLIVPILLVGGAYLSYEGAEKILEWLLPKTGMTHAKPVTKPNGSGKIASIEQAKIKAAIRTDFILSIEIIVITLSTVIDQSLPLQIAVVSLIALLATVGVYGLVALIVRMDDVGLSLIQHAKQQGLLATIRRQTGHALIVLLPRLIRVLEIIGTITMLLVGGGMFVHNIQWMHTLLHGLPSILPELIAGLVIGFIVTSIMHIMPKSRS